MPRTVWMDLLRWGIESAGNSLSFGTRWHGNLRLGLFCTDFGAVTEPDKGS